MKLWSADQFERFLTIALLACLAITQPLLDLFGRQAEFLVAHQLSGIELLIFTLLLAIIVPALIALLPVLTGKINKDAGRSVFYLLFVVLSGLISLPLLIASGFQGISIILVSVASGILGLWLFHRFETVRLFFRYFSAAVLVLPVIFLFFSRATALLLPQETASGHAPVSFQSRPDIVFLVLDEFPLVSLLNSELEINQDRFPHFARLADQASWYRAATSPAETTVAAVPAILSGRHPIPGNELLPITANYPRNLFTLLQDDYRMIAYETATRLCPASSCNNDRRMSNGNAVSGNLLNDLKLIYQHIVTPLPWSQSLPSISNAWSGFASKQAGTGLESSQDTGLQHAIALAELSRNVSWNTRAREVEQFISAIEPGQEPALYYLHSLLPHAEWRYLRSGQQYLFEEHWEAMNRSQEPGMEDSWANDSFAVTQQWQRHILQVQYVDTLLGKLLDQLEKTDMLDSTLLVVTGDHGSSFVAGQPRRSINATTLTDISAVPLLIKYPGHQAGNIVDSYASLSDVLPTLVDVMGITVNWAFDGVSLLSNRDQPENIQVQQKNGSVFEYELKDHHAHLKARAAEMASVFDSHAPKGLFEIGPAPQLLHHRPEEFTVSNMSEGLVQLEGEQLYRNVQTSASFVPRLVKGVISGLADSEVPRNIAIAVNGRFEATTQTLVNKPYQNSFSALLDEDVLLDGLNTVQIYLINAADQSVLLSPLERPGALNFTLRNDSNSEMIHSSESGKFEVSADQFAGRVSSFQSEAGALVQINGTVGDSLSNESTVLVFMDDQLAGISNIEEGRYSLLVPSAGGEQVRARVFVLNDEQQLALEATYPAACSSQWLFSNDSVTDCDATTSPLNEFDGQLSATLDMSDPGINGYLTGSWGDQSGGIVWSLGKSSRIEIPVPSGLQNLSFKAVLMPFLHAPELEIQSLWITANGTEAGSWKLNENKFTSIEWSIPRHVLQGNPKLLELNFLLPDAVSPLSINAGNDKRTLGVAIQRIEIKANH